MATISDLSKISESKEKIISFLHLSLDDLLSIKTSLKLDSFNNDLAFMKSLEKEVQQFVTKSVGTRLSSDAMKTELNSLGLADPYTEMIIEVVKARGEDIQKWLSTQLQSIFPTHLSDFDWSVRQILSSDKLSSMKETVMLLELSITDSNDQIRKIQIELTKDKLDDLLENCRQIHTVLAGCIPAKS